MVSLLLACCIEIKMHQIVSLKVLEHIKYVNFTTQNGAKVFFDENGDSVAQYDIVNWQIKEDGSAEIVDIGQYDTSFPEGKHFKLKDNTKIIWRGNNDQVKTVDICMSNPQVSRESHFCYLILDDS